ncbi:DUF3914 domain-containing protein [Bacillus thuringiensis]|uniref:DUF3914 domain-containing protein n=1 Tax=Bacillus thuringiensis TaxID=1428 RepID=UPI000A365FC5|nr:DUF3914 domain-containing protein [Bacillus thuringiensis]MED3351864.1 DUF3914 domain-containing protein [Bacillus thuringiensis]MRB11822.1 DUF3914 domain-containing protein [Bacillus thuringiensis]OTW94397.1 hypothetical protein BK711_22920 [Bacillus thuringiensis serovar fukuokaensis]
MEISLNTHRVNQSTMYSNLDTLKNNQDSPSSQGKKDTNNVSIKFDIRSSEKEIKQTSPKFTEMDLWKMLKDKGVSLRIIMEMLNKFRADKEKESIQANNDSPNDATNTIELTNGTRLEVVL